MFSLWTFASLIRNFKGCSNIIAFFKRIGQSTERGKTLAFFVESAQILDDFGRYYQSGDGRNECVAGGNRLSVWGELLFQRRYRRLRRIDALELPYSAPLQFAAHDAGERTDRRVGNVGDTKARRVDFVAGTHAANDEDSKSGRAHRYLDFSGNSVYAVHNVVVQGKVERGSRLRGEKHIVLGDGAFRVDVENPLSRDIDFLHSDCRVESDNLPVQVRDANSVVVHDVDGTDSASGEGFDGMPSDPSDTENDDAGVEELLHPLLPERQRGPGKLFSCLFHNFALLGSQYR